MMIRRIQENIDQLLSITEKNKKFLGEIPDSKEISSSNANKLNEYYGNLSELKKEIKQQAKVAEQKKTVVLFGKFSTGKSTLLNGLLSLNQSKKLKTLEGKDDPTTAKPVRITFSEEAKDETARYISLSGEKHNISIKKAYELMTSSGPEAEDVQEIILKRHHHFLANVDIVDLPGRDAAFFDEHEEIVRARMKDGAMIFWLHGGIDQRFPGIHDLNLIAGLPGDSDRKVIGIWNAKQGKNKSLEDMEPDEKEKLLSQAQDKVESLSDDISGLVSASPLIVWAQETVLNQSDGWRERTNLNELVELKEELITTADSPIKIAATNLVDRKQEIKELNRDIIGILAQEINDTEEEKRKVKRGLTFLDEAIYNSHSKIENEIDRSIDDVVENKIEPSIRRFIDAETSPGGVIQSAWRSKSISPKKFKEKLENSLEASLEETLNFGDPENGWLAKFIRQNSDKIATNINRIWNRFEMRLKDELNLEILDSASTDNNQSALDNKPQMNGLQADVAKEITTNLAAVSGAVVSAIAALIVIIMPKTGTPVDILAGLGGLIAGGFMLSTVKKRMHGQARTAAWEVGVEIKSSLRKPAIKYVNSIEKFWEDNLDIDQASGRVINLKGYKDRLFEFNQQLSDLNLEV